jgi:hypothetical protein
VPFTLSNYVQLSRNYHSQAHPIASGKLHAAVLTILALLLSLLLLLLLLLALFRN